jgi:hypothetical protein
MVYPDLIVLEEGRNIDACFRNKFKSNFDLLGDSGAQVYPRDCTVSRTPRSRALIVFTL